MYFPNTAGKTAVTGKERGPLAVERKVVCDSDDRNLVLVVGTEGGSYWCEETLRGENVENACWEASRRRLSVFKESKRSWTWREGTVRSRESILKTRENESEFASFENHSVQRRG